MLREKNVNDLFISFLKPKNKNQIKIKTAGGKRMIWGIVFVSLLFPEKEDKRDHVRSRLNGTLTFFAPFYRETGDKRT